MKRATAPHGHVSNKLLTPCAITGCTSNREPHAPLCPDHWRGLPDELRTRLDQAAQQDRTGPAHLAAFRDVLGYYREQDAAELCQPRVFVA